MTVGLQLEGLILLLVFIAPGFLYSRTYWSARLRYYKEQSPFEQVVTAVTASALIHAGLLSVLAALLLAYQGLAYLRGFPFQLPPAGTFLRPRDILWLSRIDLPQERGPA